MIYKNNYQRKQAVWREKQRKKNEERLRKKALYQPVISLRKTFAGLEDALSEMVKAICDGINEIVSDPEFIEKLEKFNASQNHG